MLVQLHEKWGKRRGEYIEHGKNTRTSDERQCKQEYEEVGE